MCKFNHISNIPAKIFFDILETKNYQLLKPKPKEQGLEQIFISIYDDFFDKSNNPEAKEYLVLVRKEAFLVYKIAVIKQALLLFKIHSFFSSLLNSQNQSASLPKISTLNIFIILFYK